MRKLNKVLQYLFLPVIIFLSVTLARSQPTAYESASTQPAPLVTVGQLVSIEPASSNQTLKVINGTDQRQAEPGSAVYKGDRVRTEKDQTAMLSFADDSTLVVGSNSDISVAEYAKDPATESSRIQLAAGLVRALVKKAYSVANPFVVETPNAAMGVRGTDFVVEHDRDSGHSELHTMEGAVVLGKSRQEFADTSRSHLVSAGQTSLFRKGMEKPEAPKSFDRDQYRAKLAARAPSLGAHPNQIRERAAKAKQLKSGHQGTPEEHNPQILKPFNRNHPDQSHPNQNQHSQIQTLKNQNMRAPAAKRKNRSHNQK